MSPFFISGRNCIAFHPWITTAAELALLKGDWGRCHQQAVCAYTGPACQEYTKEEKNCRSYFLTIVSCCKAMAHGDRNPMYEKSHLHIEYDRSNLYTVHTRLYDLYEKPENDSAILLGNHPYEYCLE